MVTFGSVEADSAGGIGRRGKNFGCEGNINESENKTKMKRKIFIHGGASPPGEELTTRSAGTCQIRDEEEPRG